MDRLSTKWDDRWSGDGDYHDPWMVRPLTPPHVEDMEWDPYMVRNQEEVSLSRVEAVEAVSAARMNNNNKMFKIVDMNKSLAHNAAGAIVDPQFVGKRSDYCFIDIIL